MKRCLTSGAQCWLAAFCLLAPPAAPSQAEGPEIRVATPSPLNREVVFAYRLPKGVPAGRPVGVLLLVPGSNSSGKAYLQPEGNDWTRFADAQGLALLAPTFHTSEEEIRSKQGYYYPALWSGQATLEALSKLAQRERVKTDRILLFGFSAGAHFAHRFANWKPERVRAFVADSAGWWDEPSAALREVPALIMCGEEDVRYGATRTYLARAQELQLPWVWRGYADTGHHLTPQVRRMAQAFLAVYSQPQPAGLTAPAYIGDLQTYEVFPSRSEAAEAIPSELRVPLPTKAVADVWRQEQ